MKIENSQRVIEEKVRPILAAHGGDIQIISGRRVLKVRFTGSCAGCAAADLTMEEVVKRSLRSRSGGKGCNFGHLRQ